MKKSLLLCFLILLTNNILFGEKVVVWHRISRNGDVENVKRHGLLSFTELFRCGLTNIDPSTVRSCLPDQHEVIYFRPELDSQNKKISLVMR